MAYKLIFVALLLIALVFISFRFGLFEKKPLQDGSSLTEQLPLPTPASIALPTSVEKEASPTTSVKILSAPKEATPSQQFTVSWLVENPKIATISHTALHFGKTSRPDAKLPSDYPEKSAIFKGTVPASFSATLRIIAAGTYYFRAHALIDDFNIWSNEQTIAILEATPSSNQ